MNQELLYKYFRGTATIEEEKRILDWVEASEENREAFLKERMIFDVALFSDRQSSKKKTFRLAPILKWGMRNCRYHHRCMRLLHDKRLPL